MKQLTEQHANEIAAILGFCEDSYGRTKARRFLSYLRGQVKNMHYDETIHWGDIARMCIPIFDILKTNGYNFSNLK